MDREQLIDLTQCFVQLREAIRGDRFHARSQDAGAIQEILGIRLSPGELLVPEKISREALTLIRLGGMAVTAFQRDAAKSMQQQIDIADGQVALFSLFEKAFRAFVGCSYQKVSSDMEIKSRVLDRVKRNPNKFGEKFNAAASELSDFYRRHGSAIYGHAKILGGLKLVLGGQRSFGPSALAGVQKMGLYVDTQLIADPIHPFLEGDLHLNALHLQLMFALRNVLQLKPLVDARLPVPPVLVFPSFEKLLEANDVKTQAGISELIVKVVAPHLTGVPTTLEELMRYAGDHSDEVIARLLIEQLFIPPGVSPRTVLTPQEAVDRYLSELAGVRDADMLRKMRTLKPGVLALLCATDRLHPQYHLIENSGELNAQPMLTQPVHWHFFEKCAQASALEMHRADVLSAQAFNTVRALQNDGLSWLSNIPVPMLAELLKNQENAAFREELAKHTAILTAAGVDDVERVMPAVMHGISSMVQKHQKTIAEIEARYAPKYASQGIFGAAATALGFAAQFFPAIGIFGVAAPAVTALGAGVAYGKDKLLELSEKKKARHSLLGVLATIDRDTAN